jgi:hypothetical protein
MNGANGIGWPGRPGARPRVSTATGAASRNGATMASTHAPTPSQSATRPSSPASFTSPRPRPPGGPARANPTYPPLRAIPPTRVQASRAGSPAPSAAAPSRAVGPGTPASRSGPAAGGSARPVRRASDRAEEQQRKHQQQRRAGPTVTASPAPRATSTTSARSRPSQRGTDGIWPTCTGFTRWPLAGPRYPAAGAGPRAAAAHTACGSPR